MSALDDLMNRKSSFCVSEVAKAVSADLNISESAARQRVYRALRHPGMSHLRTFGSIRLPRSTARALYERTI